MKLEACYFNKCRRKEIPIEYRPRLGKAEIKWLEGWLYRSFSHDEERDNSIERSKQIAR